MSRIRQLIELLRQRSDVGVVEQERSWLVVITKGQDLFCEVTIPRDVLEWFACVKQRQDKREVWSDWMRRRVPIVRALTEALQKFTNEKPVA